MRTAPGVSALVFFCAVSASAAIPASERAALEAVYNALDGPHWSHNEGWMGAAGTECDWRNVECNTAKTTVVSLGLGYANATGSIPKEIAGLTNLEVLSLQDNNITGTIPTELAQLSKLQVFNVSGYYDNNITGPIPKEFGQLTNLRVLNLEANHLTGTIPAELAQLQQLEELRISYNDLSGTMPDSILALPNLKILTARGTNLAGPLPAFVTSNLQTLDLGSNDFTGPLPPTIARLSSLEYLEVDGNELTGAIPPELNQLTKLKELDLDSNKFSGPVPQLSALGALQRLAFYSNDAITGPLPSWIGQLKELKVLGFGSTGMTGELPAELFTLPKLEVIYANSAAVSGRLLDFTKLTTLRYLYLASTKVTGPIPKEIAAMSGLVELELDHAPIGGSLPKEIGALKDLSSLSVADTGLVDPLPEELGDLAQLSRLSLQANSLSVLPASIGRLSNLTVLVMHSNKFSGPFPVAIGQLKKLVYLSVASNSFIGPIPAEGLQLPKLEEFYFYDNHLAGPLPEFATPALVTLSGASNGITVLPPNIASLKNLATIALDDNELRGDFPASLTAMPSLVSINLAGNRLSGSLPDLSGLPKLERFDVRANQFGGSIPPAVFSAPKLDTFYVSYNRLTGEVPAEIMKMRVVDLHYNGLYSTNAPVRAFLDSKVDAWSSTQTVAPSALNVAAARERSITLTWPTIEYTRNDGGYLISYATSAGGPFSVLATTPDKYATTFVVDSLQPSTAYFFNIATVTYPHDDQQNVVTSLPGGTVQTATTAGQPAPASVAVFSQPDALRQRPGATSTTAYYLGNLGDLPANVTLSQRGAFFTQSPQTFTIAGGETQRVEISGLAQNTVGALEGESIVSGNGVPPGLTIPIQMLVTEPPAGTVTAQPNSNRIDVAAPVSEGTSGTVEFRNVGTATLQGIVVSNVAWIIPPKDLIVIPPGESKVVTFQVDQTKRPDASSPAGAVIGTLSLVYESGTQGKANANDTTTPTTSSVVTVVYTVTPPVASVTIPGFTTGEVALFIPGVGNVIGSRGRQFISDVSILNSAGTGTPRDVRMYFTPANVTIGSALTQVNSLAPDQGVTFANVVKTVFNTESSLGTLQIRTTDYDKIFVSANIFNVSDLRGTYGTNIPIFRSDRALRGGESLLLSGVRRDAARTTYTNIFVQETTGNDATFDIEFLDASGRIVNTSAGQPKLSGAAAPFRLVTVSDQVPPGAVTARVTNTSFNAARIVSYATPVDDQSGDFWTVVDWNRELGSNSSEPAIIPVAGSVRNGLGESFRTDVAITNRAGSSGGGTLLYHDRTGFTRQREVTLAPSETQVINDVIATAFPDLTSALGYIEFLPRAATNLTSRTFASKPDLPGTYGTGVPSLPRSTSLRLGQTRTIAGLDVASERTILAQKAGTFRTNIGLAEIAGQSATVEVTVVYNDIKQSVSGIRLTKLRFELAPNQSRIESLANYLKQTNPSVSDLRGVQLRFQVVSGDGAVIVYTSSVDNGTADQVLRVE